MQTIHLSLHRCPAQLAVRIKHYLDALLRHEHCHANLRSIRLRHGILRDCSTVLRLSGQPLPLILLPRRLVRLRISRDVVHKLDPADAETAARLRVVLDVLLLDATERAKVRMDGVGCRG